MTHFILNKHAHYFCVTGTVNIAELEKQGCESFNTLQSLLESAAKVSGFPMEEIEGNEYQFSYDIEKKTWFETDSRGITFKVITEKTIEQYLSNWEL